MGFRNKSRRIFFFVILNMFLFNITAQESEAMNIDFIYNEWAFSNLESYDDISVYVDNFVFDETPSVKNSNLKFTAYDDTFYLKHSQWKIPPRRCGNGPIYNGPSSKSIWRKGVWSVEIDEDFTYLSLEHLQAINGGKYIRTKLLEYQILDLTENRMVLKKIIEESVH